MVESSSKIKSLDELAQVVVRAKAQGQRVAQCHGTFDLLHPGHIRYLEAARRTADLLLVTLVADQYVNNGLGRPVFNQRLRAESIAALEAVGYVSVVESATAVDSIIELRPDLFVMGTSYSDQEEDLSAQLAEEAAVRSVGGRVFRTDDIVFSSANLLNRYFPVLKPEADEYLRRFRQRNSVGQIIDQLKDLNRLKVMVIGDIILDEYHYCKAVGKASKSATLAARFLSSERHAGGVLAVANHVAGFAGVVHLLTCLGEPQLEEDFIRSRLKPNIQAHMIRQPDRPIVIKRRYVDPFQVSKMFEVMWLDGRAPSAEQENALLGRVVDLESQCDLIIVADFGHGAIGSRTIQRLTTQSAFLAVNAQTNSANAGYNLITKYPRADYICIDEGEMRLANSNRCDSIEALTLQTGLQLGCKIVSVTLGDKGSLICTMDGECVQTPVFSTNVVDTVGAGDAYLSVTALCAKMGYTPELVGFIGNCAGALAASTVGNRESVEPEKLFRLISTLLT